MRVVVALGGNALLRRGQPLTAENQRANARAACQHLAPVALEHELVISHGNGPQVGLLALQGSAYTAVEAYPLDVLGAQTEGMIGYVLQQELGNELPFEKPPRDAADADRGRPRRSRPSATRRSRSARSTPRSEAAALAAEKGWAFKPDGDEHAPRRPVAGAAAASSASSRSSGCSSTTASSSARAAAASR